MWDLIDIHTTIFGARLYDDRICRWTSQDPLAAKYPAFSPYAYCAGDPVNFVDPDGNSPLGAIGGFVISGAIGGIIGACEGHVRKSNEKRS